MKIKDYEIDYKKYLDIEDVLKFYKAQGLNKGVVITDNGTGKTFSATNLVCKYLSQGKNCAWLRNTELEADKCVNGLKAGISRLGVDGANYIVNKEGIFEVLSWKKSGNPNDTKLRCPIVYLSSLARSVPQEIHAQLIILDEFIDGNDKRRFVLKNYASDMKKAVSRLIRPIEKDADVLMIGLSNPHQPDADLLYAWNLDFDWDLLAEGKVSYSYCLEQKTYGICIPKQFEIDEMATTYEFWGGDAEVHENYKFLPNKFKRVSKIPDACVDYLGKIYTNDCMFVYGWWHDADGSQHMYARKCDPLEFEDMTCYAVTPLDVKQGARFIIDNFERFSKFYKLINSSLKFDCYFDCDYTQVSITNLHALVVLMARVGLAN